LPAWRRMADRRFVFRHSDVLIGTHYSSRLARLAFGAFYCKVAPLKIKGNGM